MRRSFSSRTPTDWCHHGTDVVRAMHRAAPARRLRRRRELGRGCCLGDAASTDGGGGDAAIDAGAVALCERSGLLFCGLEALALGAANNATSTAWDTEAANGRACAIDATHARGQRALKLAITGNGRARR